MPQQLSTNTFGVAKWVVSPDPTQGTHTTITAALASAASGDTIWVRDGTYNESFTAVDGVTLQASSSFAGFGVIVNGTLTCTGQNFVVNGVFFNTTGASCLIFSGSGVNNFYAYSCFFQNTGADMLVDTNSNPSSVINIAFCTFTGAGTNAILTLSGSSVFLASNSVFSDTATTVRSTISSGSAFSFCTVSTVITFASSTSLNCYYTIFGTTINAAAVIVNNGTNTFFGCYFNLNNSGANDTFTCTSPAIVAMTMCSFITLKTTGFLVGGNGTIFYAACSQLSASAMVPVFNSTLTLNELPIRLGNATNFTNVALVDSPYTINTADQTLLVDTSGGAISLLFPDSPEIGQEWTVKDNTGNAAANNIILTTVSGTDMIDGATSQSIATNYGSAILTATSATTYIITG